MTKLDLHFDPQVIDSFIGGLPSLDMKTLGIQNLAEARDFIKAYGYDLESDAGSLWKYHRRAVTFLQTELMRPEEKIPEVLTDPAQLKDLSFLLIYASTRDQKQVSLQKWSCALLKVIHVMAHLDNDLFVHYSKEIQDHVLKPIESEIHTDPVAGIGLGGGGEFIPLHKFQVKTFKTTMSSALKLIAKKELVAFATLDKVGVRFITKHLFDTFRVLRYLVRHNIVSLPNNIPDQSNNTLYPPNLFFEVMESLPQRGDISVEAIDELLRERLEKFSERAEFREKLNSFSSRDYRFIKFITRRLVRIVENQNSFSFFYPFEVQIVDYDSYLKSLSGPASHKQYKMRQREQARSRVLDFLGGFQ